MFSQTAHFAGAQTTLATGFNLPSSVAFDSSGNIYVTDTLNNAVKEIIAVNGSIPASPTIRTLGSGFQSPEGVAVDQSGNVYVADTYNDAVKEILAVNGSIPASPTIRTLVSVGLPFSVAVDRNGNVFFSGGCLGGDVRDCGSVLELVAVGGSIPSSPTENDFGEFDDPAGVAVDNSGNVYVADSAANSVKEILAVNGVIPAVPSIVVLGSGFNAPSGVAVDNNGNVYVADIGNNAVKEMLAVNGSIPSSPTILSLGAGFTLPAGVAVDGNGNVYVADAENDRVVKVSPQGANFGAVNVGTASPSISLVFSFNAASELGSVAVFTQGASGLDFTSANTGTCAVGTAYTVGQTCTVDMVFTPRFAGSRTGSAVLQDNNGNVIATAYVSGAGIAPQLNFLPNTESTVATNGLYDPYGVAVDGSGNVYIADTSNERILKETLSGGSYSETTIPTSTLNQPSGIAVDGAGNVYIADTYNSRVLKETPLAGGYTESTVASFSSGDSIFPEAVAADVNGNVYFSTAFGVVYVESLTAGIYAQSTITTSASSTVGLAVDTAGNIYVADTGNDRVLKETPAAGGYTESILPVSSLGVPSGLAVDAENNLYITDPGNDAVLKETPSNGSYTQSVISTSQLDLPFGVAVDGPGNVYIADTFDFRILKEDFADPPALSFAGTTWGTTSPDSPQTVTVENAGNAALTFPAPSSGTNPSIAANFTLNSGDASDCPLVSAGAQPATLAAGASCLLPISFTPQVSGTQSGSLILTDNNLNAAAPAYAAQGIALSGTAAQVVPVITWPTPAPIAYGTALSATQLNATANVPGTFVYSPAAGTIPPAGTDTLDVTFTPTDTTDYATVSDSVTLTVNKPTRGFKLSALPAALTIPQGGSGIVAIWITPFGGFTGKVNLSASGLPSGVTAQFLLNPATGVSALILNAGNKAKTGAVTVTLNGTSGGLTEMTTFALNVVAVKR